MIESVEMNAGASLHTRTNDFYIFAGIVITLLLAINVGLYLKADEEIERHFDKRFGEHEKKFNDLRDDSIKTLNDLRAVKKFNSKQKR